MCVCHVFAFGVFEYVELEMIKSIIIRFGLYAYSRIYYVCSTVLVSDDSAECV